MEISMLPFSGALPVNLKFDGLLATSFIVSSKEYGKTAAGIKIFVLIISFSFGINDKIYFFRYCNGIFLLISS